MDQKNAAFARLLVPQFLRLKMVVLHGFGAILEEFSNNVIGPKHHCHFGWQYLAIPGHTQLYLAIPGASA